MCRPSPFAPKSRSIASVSTTPEELRGAAVGRELTRAEVEVVLRRAAEIELAETSSLMRDCMDAATVEAVGVEAGLSREAVRRALAEVSLQGAVAVATPPKDWDVEVIERVVPLSAAETDEQLAVYLDRQLFAVKRTQPGWTLYEPKRGARAHAAREADVNGRLCLRRVDEVLVVTSDGPSGSALVRVELRRRRRKGKWKSAAFGAAFAAGMAGLAGGAVLSAVVDPSAVADAAPAALLSTGGAFGGVRGWFRARSRHRRFLGRARDGLELRIDELELRR